MADDQTSPNETRWRDLRTGMLFVAGLVLAAVLGLIIGKNTGILTRHDKAYIFLEDIKGLTEGNMVTIAGKKVGTIATMQFEARHDTSGIRIALDIRDEYFKLINADSRAVVKSLGVLGDKYVDIQLGRSTEPLSDGGWLSASHAPGVDELTTSALETMGQIGDISAKINRGEGTVGKLISSNELADKMMNTASNLEEITGRLRKGQGLAGKVLADDKLAEAAVGIVGDLRTIVSGLRQGKGTAGRLLMDSTLYYDLHQTVTRSDSLLARIDSPAGTTGRFIHDPSVYTELSRALASLDSLLVDLKQNPGRYVRISVF